MKAEKRRRLEGAGWRVGSAADFLGLSDVEAALVDMKINLGELARTTRINKHVSQEQLAQWLSSSQSRISKLERGRASVSLDLLLRTLLIQGVTASACAAVIARSGSPPRRSSVVASRASAKDGRLKRTDAARQSLRAINERELA